MFGPTYTAGCPTNSSIADEVDRLVPHLHARDASFVIVSRAPLERLRAYQRRMGWTFPWVSSGRTDFNVDFGISVPVEETTPPTKTLTPEWKPEPASSGTDVVTYLSEVGINARARQCRHRLPHVLAADRGVEFSDGYGVLDRTPKAATRATASSSDPAPR
jgi:predicted dithiol-disulfide oxidoreductase (DUF899 family)